jgi:hypothetical protein
MTTTEYATYYKSIAAKYQAIRPQVAKWASNLTLAQLTDELNKNKVRHITDLVDVVARQKTLA